MNTHSIAIWAKVSASDKDPKTDKDLKTDLHINVWKLSESSCDRHLDVGIMLNDRQGVHSLFIYVPVQDFSLDDFSDLGGLLLDDSATCAAVFNEHLTITKKHPAICGDVTIHGKKSEKNLAYIE